jgi:hypothetical protein
MLIAAMKTLVPYIKGYKRARAVRMPVIGTYQVSVAEEEVEVDATYPAPIIR